jgi:hypothetical protein
MTDPVSRTQLENANLDAVALDSFVNGPATPGTYTTRTGRIGKTLAKLQAESEAAGASGWPTTITGESGATPLTINGSVEAGGTGYVLTVTGTSSGGSTYTRMYTGVFQATDTVGDTNGHVVALVARAYTENNAADHDLMACVVAQAKFKEYAVPPGSFGFRVEHDDPVNYPGWFQDAYATTPGVAAFCLNAGCASINADGTAKQSDGQIIRLHSVNGSLTDLYGQVFAGYDGTINLNPDAAGTKTVSVGGKLFVSGDVTVYAGAAGSTQFTVSGADGLGATINYDTALSAIKPVYAFWYESGSGIGHPAANTMSGIIQSVEVWRTTASGFEVTGWIKPKTYTVSTLPTASAAGAGARAEVSDAADTPAWGAAATGGGANQAPVRSTGSAWVYG